MTRMDLLEFRHINGPDSMPTYGAIWTIGLFRVNRLYFSMSFCIHSHLISNGKIWMRHVLFFHSWLAALTFTKDFTRINYFINYFCSWHASHMLSSHSATNSNQLPNKAPPSNFVRIKVFQKKPVAKRYAFCSHYKIDR